MIKEFEVNNTAKDDTYIVTFKFEDDKTSINCTCQAGWSKMLCKHRLNLIDGDYSGLVNQSEATQVK